MPRDHLAGTGDRGIEDLHLLAYAGKVMYTLEGLLSLEKATPPAGRWRTYTWPSGVRVSSKRALLRGAPST